MRLDHATIAGRNLAHLRDLLAAVDLHSEYGGPHANGITEMAIVSFANGSYLELIAWKSRRPGSPWARFMNENAGPCAWAVHVSDIAAEVQRLRDAGVAVTAPEQGGRTRPDGVRLEWMTAGVGPGGRGSLLPFLIQDITPRERRVYPSGKPAMPEVPGVAMAVIGVKDLPGAIALYRRAFSLPDPQQQDDPRFTARLAWFPDTPVVLASPLDAPSWLAGRINRLGEAPCAFLLSGNPDKPRTSWFGKNVSWLDAAKAEGIRLGLADIGT